MTASVAKGSSLIITVLAAGKYVNSEVRWSADNPVDCRRSTCVVLASGQACNMLDKTSVPTSDDVLMSRPIYVFPSFPCAGNQW